MTRTAWRSGWSGTVRFPASKILRRGGRKLKTFGAVFRYREKKRGMLFASILSQQLFMELFCIPKCRIRLKWAVAAVLLPVLVSAVYLLLPGSFVENTLDTGTKFACVTRGIFIAGLGAGVVEELLFRGLLMNAVIKKWGRAAGILAPSVLFASLHIIDMDFSLLSCLQVMAAGTMVGVMFSLIALEGQSVWNSAVVHGVWNMIIIGGGMTIGTEVNEYSVSSYVLETRNFLLTGGEFGIESSVVAILGYIAVSLMAVGMMRRKVS